MKTITTICSAIIAMFMATTYSTAQSQIQFQGLVSTGQGIAGWNADGTGPEPEGMGHIPAPGWTHMYYYGSSHDYITGDPNHAAFHFIAGMTGFPEFELALADNGFTPEQVKVRYGLASLKNDVEGMDWYTMNDSTYANYYACPLTFELAGQPMLAGFLGYAIMYIDLGSGNTWLTETSYSRVQDISAASPLEIQAVAHAFLNDLDGQEIKLHYESTSGQMFAGNGRSGYYFNVLNGVLTVGHPEMPFKGLSIDHEGFAGWDADGTGPEPYGNGHASQMYYGASLDYDGIDPDPRACLGHFTPGSMGFFNTLLQLQYRGFNVGDMKIKYGLTSLGPDVFGEDWGYSWCNYYNNTFTVELNGEPILVCMEDTNKLESHASYWSSITSPTRVYDISENASPEAQCVARSFLKDLGTHYGKTSTGEILYVQGSDFTGNGRSGAMWEITAGSIIGLYDQATFIPESEVSGTWLLDGSPYYIDGHLTIADGQTLTIEPGVRVAVRGPYHFSVQGCVKAEGTAEQAIVFTHSNPLIWWDGFDYDQTPATNEASVFNYGIFEYSKGWGEPPANSGGAFVISDFDKVEIENSEFRYNRADLDNGNPPCGGAIAFEKSDPVIRKCIFHDNYADYGGAVFCHDMSYPVVSNCLFYGNEAQQGGALCFHENAFGTFINNTIAANTADEGGGLYLWYYSNPEVINTILWGNEATTSGNQVYLLMSSVPGFYYCDIEGGQESFGGIPFTGDYLFNQETDPMFIGSEEHPWSLLEGSICYNAGTPDTSLWFYPEYLPETGLAGMPRILDGIIDIGAYEILITGINDEYQSARSGFSVYPNPASGRYTLEFELAAPAPVSLEIFNSTGQHLSLIENATFQDGIHRIVADSESLPQGMYYCRLRTGNDIRTAKLMVLGICDF